MRQFLIVCFVFIQEAKLLASLIELSNIGSVECKNIHKHQFPGALTQSQTQRSGTTNILHLYTLGTRLKASQSRNICTCLSGPFLERKQNKLCKPNECHPDLSPLLYPNNCNCRLLFLLFALPPSSLAKRKKACDAIHIRFFTGTDRASHKLLDLILPRRHS